LIELSENIFNYFADLYGKDIAEKYREYIRTDHFQFIRISKFADEQKIISKLKSYGVELEKVESIPLAYKIIYGNEIIGKTLEHALGKYYIQSLSSMIPPLVLNPNENDFTLDLCAAPGSKTTELADLMNNKGVLVANEISVDRVKMLVHNLDRMSFVNTGVITSKGELLHQYFANYFDKILVDAPCSALGVIQKKNEVSNWWNLDRVENISAVQVSLLVSAIKMAKVGAEIVYSTCTLTLEENEFVINKVLEKYPLEVLDFEIPLKSNSGFTNFGDKKLNPNLEKAKRILPWENDSEGFFIIKLKKIDEVESKNLEPKFKNEINLLTISNKEIKSYTRELSNKFGINKEIWNEFKYIKKSGDLFFIHKNCEEKNLNLFTRLGTKLGTFDNRGNIHLHSFAAQYFENEISENIFEISDEKQLKDYFNGGIIRTNEISKGQKIIKYDGNILGTAAPVNNGFKSQLPKSKRISEINYF